MEKIKLNNQVVLMRKYVKQAKVRTINKLVKQVKLLQSRKGDEIQVQKAKRKAERFLEEISLLKKIKPDSVSKLALSKTKDWKEVLLQKNSTLEDRCIAMLASYGPVQKEVEDFHNSNKDLVSKIADLIKQWEEKNKFLKKSPVKKSDLGKQENSTNMQKMKVTEGLLSDVTNQSETTDNGNNKPVDKKTESSSLTDNSHELKRGKRKIKGTGKQKQISKEASKGSLPIEKISEVSDNNEDLGENVMEIEESDNVENKSKNMLDNDENESENDTNSDAEKESKDGLESDGNESENDTDSDAENESKDGLESDENESENDTDSDAEKESKDDLESDDENESNIDSNMEENDDFKLEDIQENELKTKGSKIKGIVLEKSQLSKRLEFNNKSSNVKNSVVSDTNNLNTSCSPQLKLDCIGSKSGENKLKAIAVLNLDDLKGLDEIPVYNSVKNSDSGEEEEGTDEDSINDASQNDPFFLGHDEAVSTENRLVDSPMNSDFVSVDKIFERKEKSNNESKYVKNFKKTLNRSRFSSRNSSDYKKERNSTTFMKDKFMAKNDQGRFQDKSKNSYGRKNSKNRFEPYKRNNFDQVNSNNNKEFKKKNFSETYGNNKHNNSNDLYCRNAGDNSFGKSKRPHQKDDLNIKPLHPSWEAKRKEKELINTSFQGKKVVFKD